VTVPNGRGVANYIREPLEGGRLVGKGRGVVAIPLKGERREKGTVKSHSQESKEGQGGGVPRLKRDSFYSGEVRKEPNKSSRMGGTL